MSRLQHNLVWALAIFVLSGQSYAEQVRVAVASNFANTIQDIAELFERESNHQVTLIVGSTGKQYAQIKHGAPFDAFFAADSRRPELLETEGLIQKDSRFTYAVGKVVLWSPDTSKVDDMGNILDSDRFHYLSIANPKLAPYGKAAQQILTKRNLWKKLRGRMVRGENIGQAYQFVNSENADIGFVALSQIKQPGHEIKGSYWQPSQSLYSPIEQQAVLLSNKKAASDFVNFVKSDKAREIIKGYGYGTL